MNQNDRPEPSSHSPLRWDQEGDIRDVISIGKLVRKNDGPEEVEQILRTMVKYGRMVISSAVRE
jgi:hypothetical protein